MEMRERSCWLSLFLLIPLPFLYPQAVPKPGTPSFTLNVRDVIVDVVVTNSAGAPVTGLQQRDFKVLEDGKEQELRFFEEHSGATATETGKKPGFPSPFPGFMSNAPAEGSDGSLTVLLLDELNTAAQYRDGMFGAAAAFIQALPVNSEAAVFVLRSKLEPVQGFTTDSGVLRAALETQRARAASNVSGGARTAEDDRDDQMTDAVFAASGTEYQGGRAMKQQQANHGTDMTLRAIGLLGRSLAGAPGRKSLFWFAGSFPVSLFPDGVRDRGRQEEQYGDLIRQSVDLLAEAKMAVYPVSVEGVTASLSSEAAVRSEALHGADVAGAERQQAAEHQADVVAMEELAAQTGGQALYGANDFGKQAEQALRTGSHYYTLVYTPPASKPDAKLRRIDVKTNQSDYRLAYRRGYYADGERTSDSQAADPLAAMLGAGTPESTELVYQAGTHVIAPEPEAEATRAGGNSKLSGPLRRYRVEFEVPATRLIVDQAAGSKTGKVEVAAVAYDRAGERLNWAASVNSITLSERTNNGSHDPDLALHLDLDLPPSATMIRTGVYNCGVGTVGTLELPLKTSERELPAERPSPEVAGAGMVHEPPSVEKTTEHSTENASSPASADHALEVGGGSSPSIPASASNDPVLVHRPQPAPPVHGMREGQIHLDVTVSDANGKPVNGLQPWDFKLLDNDQSRKIESFRAFSNGAVMPDPPVEVILLIDELNLSPQQVAFTRDEVTRYLRRNGGRLEHPVSLMLLSDAGLRVQPRPSTDGNALSMVVKGIGAHISTINPAMGGQGELQKFQISLRQIETIAENEASRPGRKLLIWVGPGWPLLERANHKATQRDQRLYFAAIVELTNKLREARIVVNSVSPAESTTASLEAHRFAFRDYVKGLHQAQQAESGHLALKVFVTQTGGVILGPDNDVEAQIERCVANADAFYQISFDPPTAVGADEYHDLKIVMKQPGVTVRTNSGYYNQPGSN